ncbi:MAG TPA: hypothetical protein VGZ71_02415, partial [Puia sp.]|nr:hypothetical protein [Puia sp.]
SMEGSRMLLNNRLLSYFRAGSPLDDIPLSHFARPYIKALEVYRLEGIPQARLPFELIKFRDLAAQE